MIPIFAAVIVVLMTSLANGKSCTDIIPVSYKPMIECKDPGK